MTSLTALLVLVALAAGSNAGQNSLVSFKNNGYEGVLVAIHHSVKENLAMIDEIKKLFTSASPYLHTATRQRAYFRNVSILIPETWRDRPEYEKATLETFAKADFRVDHSNPVYGHVPYTKQPGECGEPAEYVHVTPEYVLDNGTNREYNWGDPGRVIVHEFAHLRYGVFDEYGLVEDENYPLFYVGANGRPTVTGCSSRVRGTYKVYDGKTARRCMLSRLTGLPEKDCRFYPFLTRNTAKASVMFYQFIDSVDSFCEMKATEPSMQHSQFAPNKQNKLCNTGTWDVIKEHEDFTGKEGQPREITDTEPSFRVLYPRRKVTSTGVELDGERLALVLDVSESMNEKDRAFKVLQSATSFIRDSVPLGIEVGVILFNNQALNLPFLGLRKLSSEADKDRLIGSLAQYMPNLVGGSTAIGQGLQKAKTMLSAGGRSLENAHIVLMSDGYETEYPSVADVMKSDIEGTGIVVTAIGYGKVDDGLDVASKKSGGKTFYYSESDFSTALDAAMDAATAGMGDPSKDAAVLVRQSVVLPKEGSTYEGVVAVDETVGVDTKFIFMFPKLGSIAVSLTSPSGKRFDLNSPEYQEYNSTKTIQFAFNTAEVGDWTYNIEHTAPALAKQVVTVSVRSHPQGYKEPVRVRAWVNRLNAVYPLKTVIYAEVTRGYTPVLYANVTAYVERPLSQDRVTLQLRDNGAGSDNEADDGVYSAYFTTMNSNDRYSVDVRAETKPGAAMFKIGGGSGVAFATPGAMEPVRKIPAPKMNRATNAGSFVVTNYTSGQDPYPPSRIIDLLVISYDQDAKVVTLEWTEPGEDLDYGKVTGYDIRVGQSFDEVSAGFDSSSKATLLEVITPLGAGNRIQAKVKVNGLNDTLLTFAVRAIDAAGHYGEPSNVVSSAAFELEDLGLNGSQIAAIVGGCVAGTVLIVGIVAFLAYKLKHAASAGKVAASPRI